ncbi:MAG: TonB-dependent receptor [Sinobacteraceae bacterium]|nr:TonB-dependent receptor [Nevskiaceae bacterium]
MPSSDPTRLLQMILAAMPLAGLATLALAQQGSSQPQPVLALEDRSLNEVVVTAQRREERLQDVPLSVTALSASELAQQNVVTPGDLPAVVSGLVWSNQGGWIQPNIRGVSTTVAAVGSPSPIAIYLDGIYQPMQSGTAFDLPDVERIEVLKGPQGTLFGRNATGGAISIYTLNPSFTPTGKLDLTGGAYIGDEARTSGHYQARGFISAPLIADTLAGSLSASYNHTDGYLTNDLNGDRAGTIVSAAIRGKLLWKISDMASILGTAYYTHGEDETAEAGFPQNGVSVGTQYPGYVIPSKPWHYAYSGSIPGAWRNIRGASLKAQLDLEAGTLTSLTGYTSYDVHNYVSVHVSYSPACVQAFVCFDASIPMTEEAVSQEINFASKQFGIARFITGFFYLHDKAYEHDSYNDAGFTDDTFVWTNAYAFYAEGNFDIASRLTLIAGARYSHETRQNDGRFFDEPFVRYVDISWSSVTPRVSLLYRFDEALNAYFTYSQGFKAGVASGQLTDAPPASPEKLASYEIGVKAAAQRYSVNAAAFYYDYRDLQVEVFNNLVTTPQNAAKAEVYGLDLDATANLSEPFEVRLATTWLPTAKYTSFPRAITFVEPLTPAGLATNTNFDASGTRMLTTPRWTGTLSGTYRKSFGWGQLATTASIYHSDAYRWDYSNTVSTGSYNLINARVTFAPRSGALQYSVYGRNLANKAYVQGSVPTTEAHMVFYGQPREIGGTLSYNF